MGRCSASTPTSSLTSVCSENVCCYARRMQPFISTTHEPTKAIMGTLFVSNASLETSPLRTLTSVFNWRKHFMNRGFHGHTCEWNPFSRASQWMRGLSFHPCECASLPRVLWTVCGQRERARLLTWTRSVAGMEETQRPVRVLLWPFAHILRPQVISLCITVPFFFFFFLALSQLVITIVGF